jgi:CO/xanthine dehydrogenase Mo-binding subunit
MPSVGTSPRRKEGPEKLTGEARYIDDLPLKGVLHGATLRSRIARGVIREIRFDPAHDWSSFVVATAADIPGENVVPLIEKDQPLLASREIRHLEEPILVLGHPDRAKAYQALSRIEVVCDEEKPVLDMEQALTRGDVFKRFEIVKGDLEAGFRAAEAIVEEEYRVPHQEQAYIEPNGIAAWEEADGTLLVTGSMQCPYYVHKAMLGPFPRPPEKIRVIQTVTGGGFGGKEEYPNLIAGHAALLALKAGRPAKFVYDRAEDMRATTKRHPARIRHRTGVRRDGTLVAQDIEVLMDGGAYITLSPVVLSRGVLHATGPYECPNVRVRGAVVRTNTPPNGAFRGFGAPQTLFAAEMQMERIADRLGLDPLALRRRNLLRQGSVTATGQTLAESVGAEAVLEKVVAASGYRRRRRACDGWNRRKTAPSFRGVGLAAVFHGDGFTGSGEVYLKSRATVALLPNGDVEVEAASTEIGQGTSSILASIAADTLEMPYERIRVATPDTARVPNSGPTVASRTCMIVGGLVKRSAEALRRSLEAGGVSWPPTSRGLKRAARELCANGRPFGFVQEYEPPRDIRWDDESYRGDAYGVYSYAAMVVEVEIDKLTFEVKVRDVVTAQDVGKAINPLLVEGQILGGTAQGLGYALLENAIYHRGAMANASFTNYVIPTTLDVPKMRVEIVEEPYSRGPFGAKGVGELPMDVPAPAVGAAIHQATGLFLTGLPFLPERISKAMHDRAHRQS